jgi:hypothetical protein
VQKPDETSGISIRGHIKIIDVTEPDNHFIVRDKMNAIHFENFSQGLAWSMANKGENYIYEMVFGNGGSSVDPTGIITYLPTNTTGLNANLYNPTYSKIVDDTSASNLDPDNNSLTVSHVTGKYYTDILVACLLDYGEPVGQYNFDNAQNIKSEFVFDEIGLRGRSVDGTSGLTSTGLLLTHAIFMPVQKSLNRKHRIEYTVRIQTLTSLTANG